MEEMNELNCQFNTPTKKSQGGVTEQLFTS